MSEERIGLEITSMLNDGIDPTGASDDWRMKAMDVTNRPVVKLLISERDELRTRLEQSEAALGVATKALAEWVDLIHTNEQGCHECSRCWQSTRLLEADIQHEEGCPVAAMRIALSTEAIAAEVERRKRTDAVVEEARAYMAAKEGEEWWASRYISLREAFAAMDAK